MVENAYSLEVKLKIYESYLFAKMWAYLFDLDLDVCILYNIQFVDFNLFVYHHQDQI